jgi:hypothetical protein
VKGILADVSIEGQFQALLRVFQIEPWKEFWADLNLATPRFADLGLVRKTTDWVVWQTCQREQLVLVTENRNANDPDSLEEVIRALNTPDSLPVLTLANAQRIVRERSYAELTAVRMLDILFDIDRRRGAGRLYVP